MQMTPVLLHLSQSCPAEKRSKIIMIVGWMELLVVLFITTQCHISHTYDYGCGFVDDIAGSMCLCHYIDEGTHINADCSGQATLPHVPDFTRLELKNMVNLDLRGTPFCIAKRATPPQFRHINILCQDDVSQATEPKSESSTQMKFIGLTLGVTLSSVGVIVTSVVVIILVRVSIMFIILNVTYSC